MSNYNCDCRCGFSCTAIGVVVSLVIGIITAFLSITATITVTPAFLWVALGIAVVYLAVLLLSNTRTGGFSVRKCVCSAVSALLIGILGTALTSVILLAVTFAATSVIGAVIIGTLLFFLSLILTETACLVRCLAGCSDDAE